MHTRRLLVGALLALLTAGAAPAYADRPARPAVVTDGPAKLLAFDSDDDDESVCVGIDVDGGSSETCDTAEVGAAIAGATVRGTTFVGAAVPAAATTVEVRRAGQLLSAGATVAGEAYTGKRAGMLRFALVRLPAGARRDGLRVRALAANGALLAVLSVSSDRELVSDRRSVLSGRSGAVRWSIASQWSSVLESSLLDLGHETLSRCVVVKIRAGRDSSTSESCVGALPREQSLFDGGGQASANDRCAPDFRLLFGVAAAPLRATAVLGDGTTRVARVKPIGDGRNVVYALVVPRAAAVRSVRLDAGDGGSKVVRLGLAPLAVGCATAGSGDPDLGIGGTSILTSPFANLPPVVPVGPVTTIAGSPAIRVADGPGDSLCVAVGDRPFTAIGCGVVSPLLSEALGTYDDINDPHAFVVVLPARVATLRIAGPGGVGTRDIPTLPASGYAGRYAGYVRFVAATIADFRELTRIAYLDAAGTVLHAESFSASNDELAAPRVSTPRRIAGRAGGPSLWQTAVRASGASVRCLALTRGALPARDQACRAAREARSVLFDVPCATHRLTVAVAVAAGTRVFATTGAARVRPIRLRGGAGLLTLRASSRLRSLTFVRKGRRSRLRVDAPPGARQCGWAAAPDVEAR